MKRKAGHKWLHPKSQCGLRKISLEIAVKPIDLFSECSYAPRMQSHLHHRHPHHADSVLAAMCT
jgi:hypothetical protein